MTAPVEIPIVLKGLPQAKEAFKDLRELILKLEKDTSKIEAAGSKRRIKIFEDEIKEKKRLLNSVKRRNDENMDRALGGGSRPSLGKIKTGVSNPSFASGAGNIDFGSMAKFATMAGGIGIALGLMKGALSLAVEGLKQFGSFLLTDIVKPQMELETFAMQLENSTNGQVKAQELMDKSNQMQARWNIDAMKAATAISELTDATGDGKLAMDMMDTFAQLNKGYGIDTQQLSGLAAAMYKEGMGAEDIKMMLGTQLAQGQITGGKFTLKQVAGLGGEFTRGGVNLAGSEDLRMASIGAALQTGGIVGKADMSMNNLNKFLEEASGGKGATIAKNKEGQIGDLGDAIRANLIASGGNASKFKSMGFTESSQAFLKQYLFKFNEAKKAGASDKEAAAKATKTFEEMRKAVADEVAIKTAANKVMETSGEKWDKAMNQIKDKLLSIMPAVQGFVDEFAEQGPALAEAAKDVAGALIWLVGAIKGILQGLGLLPDENDKPIKIGSGNGKYVTDPVTGKSKWVRNDQKSAFEDPSTREGMMSPEEIAGWLNSPQNQNTKGTHGSNEPLPISVSKEFGPPAAPPIDTSHDWKGPIKSNNNGWNIDPINDKLDRFGRNLDRVNDKLDNRSIPINER